MRIKTILNRIQKHPGFVYSGIMVVETNRGLAIQVAIRPRKGSKPVCSGCQKREAGYDTTSSRRFEFVPLWGIRVFFHYAMRRVACPRCGVKVEAVPWAQGKCRLTHVYTWFLARWAKRLSWSETAEVFQTSWDTVFRSVSMAVAWGRAHLQLDHVTAIGVDEILWKRGHRYLTVVYQIDAHCKRLLWVGPDRKVKTLLAFFHWFGAGRSARLRFVCSDMWRPYLRTIAKKASQALHVLDRFHIVANMNKALDRVRASEARQLKADGHSPVLKGARWCLLKRPSNRTAHQDFKLAELLKYNLKTVRAYLLKEDFAFFWNYLSPFWAGRFLDNWCARAMRSKIDPMKKMAATLRKHRPLLLNWFRAKKTISAGAVEGFNNKAKLTFRRAYGFKSLVAVEIALYHSLGALPELKMTHRFC